MILYYALLSEHRHYCTICFGELSCNTTSPPLIRNKSTKPLKKGSLEFRITSYLVKRDLEAKLELSPALALLGGSSVLKTPARNIRVNVEEGTASHNVIVVAGEGLRTEDTIPGDLVVRTAVRVPRTLSWRQGRILRRFASLEPVEVGRTIAGVPSVSDHKLEVNVVEADKIVNLVVKEEIVKKMDKTITATIRDKLGMRPAKPKPSMSHMPHKIF